MGVVMLQDQGIGVQHVAYHARKMNKHEVHYLNVHEPELLAMRDGYILTLGFMRKSKALTTRIYTCLPGNLCIPSLYVNRMDSCTPTGQE
jgi:hypothetical protein